MSGQAQTGVEVVIDWLARMSCKQCGQVMDLTGVPPFAVIECPNCGTELSVPAKLDNYVVKGLAGRGGMGSVYVARDPNLDREIAIKVMQDFTRDDADQTARFEKEARAAAKLNHPNVAQVYSFGAYKNHPYIVMELVKGLHFDEMIEEQGPLDQALVLAICLDIAVGLQAADDAGLIHSDIKPANVLLDERMNAKLVDFGLAGSSGQSMAGKILGTPYYIAPERLERKKMDARSDIYSLGGTLFHGIAGQPPFDADTPNETALMRLTEPPSDLTAFRPDVDSNVLAIITRMMEVSPTRRYPNYRSLTSDMRKALDAMGGDPRARRATRRRVVGRTGHLTTRVQTGGLKTGLLQTGRMQTGRMQTGMLGGPGATPRGPVSGAPRVAGPPEQTSKKGLLIGISAAAGLIITGTVLGIVFSSGRSGDTVDPLFEESVTVSENMMNDEMKPLEEEVKETLAALEKSLAALTKQVERYPNDDELRAHAARCASYAQVLVRYRKAWIQYGQRGEALQVRWKALKTFEEAEALKRDIESFLRAASVTAARIRKLDKATKQLQTKVEACTTKLEKAGRGNAKPDEKKESTPEPKEAGVSSEPKRSKSGTVLLAENFDSVALGG